MVADPVALARPGSWCGLLRQGDFGAGLELIGGTSQRGKRGCTKWHQLLQR